jgi:hypothetical protein
MNTEEIKKDINAKWNKMNDLEKATLILRMIMSMEAYAQYRKMREKLEEGISSTGKVYRINSNIG